MKITNQEHLREIYGHPKGRAKNKVLHSLEKHAINFIATSPFLVASTFNNKGQLVGQLNKDYHK